MRVAGPPRVGGARRPLPGAGARVPGPYQLPIVRHARGPTNPSSGGRRRPYHLLGRGGGTLPPNVKYVNLEALRRSWCPHCKGMAGFRSQSDITIRRSGPSVGPCPPSSDLLPLSEGAGSRPRPGGRNPGGVWAPPGSPAAGCGLASCASICLSVAPPRRVRVSGGLWALGSRGPSSALAWRRHSTSCLCLGGWGSLNHLTSER